MRTKLLPVMAVGLALSACAGRDPQPIASVQPQDAYSDCTMIRAEIEANNAKATQLANEQGGKVAQNVAARRRACHLACLVRDGLQGCGREGRRRPSSPPAVSNDASN